MSESHDQIAAALVETHRDEALTVIKGRIDEWGGLSVTAEDNDCGGVVGFWDPNKVMNAVCRIHDKPPREATDVVRDRT